ncbi:hypothetical protein SAMN05216302_101173 [Nitrosomonas aestuarii]|uniref:Uncharacterized protein n=1 Tax=Nitrosomonas aestuarii TaxID=52441 RepID=A0A1I4B9C3_9PROT|nr:hypothetical protein [Nitrosomonas aestuarii]SFK64697.1 hypothetical protein SAMN05216302_101173 [Nitrosomonas aestuarii]
MYEKEAININYFGVAINIAAAVIFAIGLFAVGIILAAKINNKDVVYFNGELRFYNPVIAKTALLVIDSDRAELAIKCDDYPELTDLHLYLTAMYGHNANKTWVAISNDHYRSIYGVNHPCHKTDKEIE